MSVGTSLRIVATIWPTSGTMLLQGPRGLLVGWGVPAGRSRTSWNFTSSLLGGSNCQVTVSSGLTTSPAGAGKGLGSACTRVPTNDTTIVWFIWISPLLFETTLRWAAYSSVL